MAGLQGSFPRKEEKLQNSAVLNEERKIGEFTTAHHPHGGGGALT
jgi:hypothetical protein